MSKRRAVAQEERFFDRWSSPQPAARRDFDGSTAYGHRRRGSADWRRLPPWVRGDGPRRNRVLAAARGPRTTARGRRAYGTGFEYFDTREQAGVVLEVRKTER